MEAKLRQLESALREKVMRFDDAKEKSKSQVISNMKELRDQINAAETEILRKIDRVFEDNVFATALAEVENSISSKCSVPTDFNKLSNLLRRPIPSIELPSSEDFYNVKKAILVLCNPETKPKPAPQRLDGKALSFSTIELSWESVPGAVAYQVETCKQNTTIFSKVYEGNSLKCTVTGLKPKEKSLFHLRAVYGSGKEVSEWSKTIKVTTPKIPVPWNVSANTLPGTVNVNWNPIDVGADSRSISYKVKVVENSKEKNNTYFKDCGQDTILSLYGKPSTKYTFYVQAGKDGAWGEWSDPATIVIPESTGRGWY